MNLVITLLVYKQKREKKRNQIDMLPFVPKLHKKCWFIFVHNTKNNKLTIKGRAAQTNHVLYMALLQSNPVAPEFSLIISFLLLFSSVHQASFYLLLQNILDKNMANWRRHGNQSCNHGGWNRTLTKYQSQSQKYGGMFLILFICN